MMSSRRVATHDGGYLYAKVQGPENAPCVVFCNSVLTDARIWDSQIEFFKSDYRVCSYDQRGHGQSSNYSGKLSFDDYGRDLIRVLDDFGVDRFHFIGLSMGVPTGLAALKIFPDRFMSFVAVDGLAKSAPGREAFWTGNRKRAESGELDRVISETVSRWLQSTPPQDDQYLRLLDIMRSTSVGGFSAATFALQSYDYSSAISKIKCPFLGIAGSDDGTMPSAMRAQFSEVRNGNFFDVEAAGHVPNFEKPSEFNSRLLDFLVTSASPSQEKN